jgi:hypothetical protein
MLDVEQSVTDVYGLQLKQVCIRFWQTWPTGHETPIFMPCYRCLSKQCWKRQDTRSPSHRRAKYEAQ